MFMFYMCYESTRSIDERYFEHERRYVVERVVV